MKLRSSSKLGHVGSKTRSLGQILGKPCVHSRGHSFDPKIIKLCQNSLKLGQVGSKTKSLGRILEKHCAHSRGLCFDPNFM